MRDLGYVEGRNLVVEYRHGSYARLPDFAAELVRLRVDVLVSMTPQAALAAKAATTTIPIVFLASDPVAAGIVLNLARPGGNLTGVSYEGGLEIYGKQMEMLKQVVPTLSRVVVPAPGLDPDASPLLSNLRAAARALGVSVYFLKAHEQPAEFDKVFGQLVRQRGDTLLVPPQPFFFTHLKWIVDLAARRRLPAVYTLRAFVTAGGLMAYGPNAPALNRRVAVYVDKILKGGNPGDIPVEQPTTFEMTVNLKTAKALGLTIPPSLLLRADQVVQ
jgi:putative ABC transport system substrate-binding protein